MGNRACLYLRVSTSKQAEKDLSIPDQRNSITAWCEAQGHSIVNEFIEPGASATTDNRPAFQEMIAWATGPDRPVDLILVHSLSRFARNNYDYEHYRRKLASADVKLVAITQDFGADPSGDLIRSVLTAFDEHQSKENSKHVRRTMIENARQGFWNGSTPALGYKTVVAENRGMVEKKKLAIDPREAEIVCEIFRLYETGSSVRDIANELNGRGMRNRKGNKFSIQTIHKILKNPSYKGTHYFNRINGKTGAERPYEEWVSVPVPVIIEPDRFDAIQDRLESRGPGAQPPRLVASNTLLTGLTVCGHCESPMRILTGKGGKYRYYCCTKKQKLGACACSAKNVPMMMLDELVIDSLFNKVFHPERAKMLLADLMARMKAGEKQFLDAEKRLKRELRQTEERIDRLLGAIADGLVEDDELLRRNLNKHKQCREDLIRRLAGTSRRREWASSNLTDTQTSAFINAVRQRLTDQNSKMRRELLRYYVDTVEVNDNEIRISGSKAALASGIAASSNAKSELVPSSVPEWWS
ncbi:MAG: recombinase family protein [Alphaproteobacteria bacterium]